MMMKVDFASIRDVGKKPKGLLVTLFVNWLVKPFSMALIRLAVLPPYSLGVDRTSGRGSVHRGLHHFGRRAVHCHGFAWSDLTDGDPAYTLMQVSVSGLIMLFIFAPIVRFLVNGASSLHVPFRGRMIAPILAGRRPPTAKSSFVVPGPLGRTFQRPPDPVARDHRSREF